MSTEKKLSSVSNITPKSKSRCLVTRLIACPIFLVSLLTKQTIVGIYDGLLENNFSVDTTINYKLPIREHIYSIAKIISKGIDSFKELYDEQFEIEYFGKNFTTIPVVEYLCERRPFDDEITFEQLCVIFSP